MLIVFFMFPGCVCCEEDTAVDFCGCGFNDWPQVPDPLFLRDAGDDSLIAQLDWDGADSRFESSDEDWYMTCATTFGAGGPGSGSNGRWELTHDSESETEASDLFDLDNCDGTLGNWDGTKFTGYSSGVYIEE